MNFKFAIGDRVARRPRSELNIASNPASRKAFLAGANPPCGTVTGFKLKTNSRGASRKFIEVRWDGSSSISEHEQMRLCPANEPVA